MIPCGYRRACTSAERGFTLIEVIVTSLIVSIAVLGLSTVYVLGLDMWQKTEKKIRLQQNGSYALKEFEHVLQGASSVFISENSITAVYPDSPSVELSLQDGALMKNSRRMVPFDEWDTGLQVKDMQITQDPVYFAWNVALVLSFKNETKIDEMEFATKVYARNGKGT